MTKQEFWRKIESAVANWSNCDICPIKQYGVENNTDFLCNELGDCADALRELALRLERENNDDR